MPTMIQLPDDLLVERNRKICRRHPPRRERDRGTGAARLAGAKGRHLASTLDYLRPGWTSARREFERFRRSAGNHGRN